VAVIQVLSKLWMFLISTPHKNRTFTVWLAVITKYQGNGFGAEVLLGRDHSRVVQIGPIVRGVIAFPILGTWWDATTQVVTQSVHWQASYGILNIFQQWPSSFWIFKILIFDHVTVIVVRICCCMPNFSVNDFAKNFRSQTPKMQFWAMNRTFKREWQKFKDL